MTTEPVSAALAAQVGQRTMGVLQRAKGGTLSFSYDPAWQAWPSAFPLSLSMPLHTQLHRHETVSPFLWNLLPDNERIIAKWAKRFSVSAGNVFGIIAQIGEDCAGAVRFIDPAVTRKAQQGKIRWLKDSEVAERLRDLHSDASAWRRATDEGQFSLAGAQPKIALVLQGKRWGLPSGGIPTTHILKPGVLDLDHQELNEHFCLSLARALKLPTASSWVQQIDGVTTIVVERYDRVSVGKTVERLHQEDFCQALGQPPASKYQADGGPSAEDCVALLRAQSSDPTADVATFLDALIFNWLIGGTDAHAKNYSLLIAQGGAVRLAPLYDLMSALPYPKDMPLQKLKLAMKIGDKYRVRDIGPHQWTKFASSTGLPKAEVLARVAFLAERLPDAAAKVRTRCADSGLAGAGLDTLHDCVVQRAQSLSRPRRV